jgi:outer membrane protein assembly factor BamB
MKNIITVNLFFFLLSITYYSCKKNNNSSSSSTPVTVDSAKMNDVMYIVTDIGMLAALDANTGATKWTFVLDKNANINTTAISSSPTFADSTVYIGSSDYNVYAIDAKTGMKRWSYHTDPITITGYGNYYSSPIVNNGVVYIGGAKLYAINTNNGTLKWTSDIPDEIPSSPTVVNNIVYANSIFNLYAFNALTGEKLAGTNGNDQYNLTYRFTYSSPCYYNGRLYDICDKYSYPTYRGTFLYAADPKTLKLAGFGRGVDYPLSNSKTHSRYSSPTIKNHTLFACSDSTLFAFDVANSNGNLKWKFLAAGDFTVSSPTADSLNVYVGDTKGIFYAVNVLTGKLDWSIDTKTRGSSHINNSPTLANGIVYFSTDKGIYAVDASTGIEKWFKPTFGKYTFAPSACVVSKSRQVFHSSISGIEN